MRAIQHPADPIGVPTIRNRILLIEDDEQSQTALATILEQEGFDVAVAPDGEDGLELARHVRPDAIVLDLVLPGMNGFDTATELRREPVTADIPLIAVTASWLGSEIDRLRAFGFDGALRKPFSSAELIEELGRHLTV